FSCLRVALFRCRRCAAAAADSGAAYDSVLAASLLQMSCKLRRCSDELLSKLRRSRHLSRTPSPTDDLPMLQQRSPDRQQQHRSQLQDSLHSCLYNLQAVQYQLSIIERAVFPQAKSGRSSALGSCSEGEYLMERDRINSEMRGFQPIEPPQQQQQQPSVGRVGK
uniref:Lzipper-MIP1 domain-containing protein n=1 Tax=Macrostomum lignano TaxID=282301 RepID=A0A1I8G5K8_9PLAT